MDNKTTRQRTIKVISARFWAGCAPVARIMASLLWRFMTVLIAMAVSFLPASWRDRLHGCERLPLLSGTALSALLQLGAVLSLLISAHSYYQNDPGLLAAMLRNHYGWFFAVNLYFILEASVRLLSAVAIGEPLGTLPLWLVERAYSGQSAAGPHGWPASGHRFGTLPRARLLRRRPVPQHAAGATPPLDPPTRAA